jgi:hypothetical protein
MSFNALHGLKSLTARKTKIYAKFTKEKASILFNSINGLKSLTTK